jgi:hypothetical protein
MNTLGFYSPTLLSPQFETVPVVRPAEKWDGGFTVPTSFLYACRLK